MVRLFLLELINLTPMDQGICGRPGKSDPYVRISLAKDVSWALCFFELVAHSAVVQCGTGV